jgi:hypothetical protein
MKGFVTLLVLFRIPLSVALGGRTELKCFMNRSSFGPPFRFHVL